MNFFFILLILLISACATQPAPTPTSPSVNCRDFIVLNQENPYCQHNDNSTLIQATNSTELRFADYTITLRGTLYSYQHNDQQFLANLSGSVVVSANQRTQIVPIGAQLILEDNAFSEPIPIYQENHANLNLTTLPNPITFPIPIAPPDDFTPIFATDTPIPTPTDPNLALTPTICAPPSDWTTAHTIQRGETLTIIANRYNLTLDELQQKNCIDDPNRIVVGQTLQLPADTDISAPTIATGTPSAVAFRADQITLSSGDCTVLRWDVDNIQQVYLEELPVAGHDQQQVCPEETMTYTLRIVYPDDTESTHRVTLTVTES